MSETAKISQNDGVGNTGLSAEELEEFRTLLVEEQKRLFTLYRHDLKSGQHSLEDGPEDVADRANLAYNRELMFSLSGNERDRLRLVEEALERLDKGQYGLCLHSGDPIALPRLQAIPWARYSAVTQEKIEQGFLEEA